LRTVVREPGARLIVKKVRASPKLKGSETMAQYEAMVLSIAGDSGEDTAEVIIQPGSADIPGVSAEVNQRVCHCASDGSSVRIEAINTAGAEVGDLVLVTHDTSTLVKNAAFLVGIPGIGLILGIVLTGMVTNEFSDALMGGIFAGAGLFACGVGVGVLLYRRLSRGSRFIIDRIIRTRAETPGTLELKPACSARDNAFCRGCSGPGL
jgi:hypothetical protein